MASVSLRTLIIDDIAVGMMDAARTTHMPTEFDALAAIKKAIAHTHISIHGIESPMVRAQHALYIKLWCVVVSVHAPQPLACE